MNTKIKQDQKKTQPQTTREDLGPKKQGQRGQQAQNHGLLNQGRTFHEQELPETRMFD